MEFLTGLGGTGKLWSDLLHKQTEEQKRDIIFIKLDDSHGEFLCEQLEKSIAEKASRNSTESGEEQAEE